jgi:phenylacetate-CoA ligase
MYAIFKDEAFKKEKEIYNQHIQFKQGSINISELVLHQNSKLKNIIKYVKENSPFYGVHLKNVSYSDIESLNTDNINSIPFTSKEDLREYGAALASMPLSKSWIYYETTGTTGKPTPCPRNEIDSIHNNTPLIINYRDIFEQHGSNHIVGVMGPTELHSTADTFEDVFRSLGYSIVKMWPRSPVVGMARAMALINELQITALVCTQSVGLAVQDLVFAREIINRVNNLKTSSLPSNYKE